MKYGFPVTLTVTSAIALAFTLLLGACATKPVEDETKNWSAQHLYGQAMDELQAENYAKSIKLLENLEARYPYGHYAQQAQLEVAYAYYKDADPQSAVDACNRFIKLHPNHPNADYAYYLKGLSNFVPNETVFSDIADQDPSERDTQPIIDSFNAFRELTTKYPHSKYTPDALLRMVYLSNLLAEHDVHIALYYYNRRAWIAAVERAQDTITHFPQSPTNELALAIMTRSYDQMGVKNLAEDSLHVLKLNFPHSAWLNPNNPLVYHGSTQPKKSWWKIWAS